MLNDEGGATSAAEPRDLLLVDDDEIFSTVLARAMERRGFRVSVAGDFEGASQLIQQKAFQFAVVDLKLPDGSGLCLVKQLVDHEGEVRIVVLTGYASIATAIEAIKLGASYYLTKPANADDIVAAFFHDAGAEDTPLTDRPLSVNRLEWEHINRVLTANSGNISATARELGMHRRTLQRKLSKHPVRS
jgi:two-component system response regulator RegA